MPQLKPVSFAEGTAPVGDTAVFEIFIKTTPERLWEAITDPEQRAKYSFGVVTTSDWTEGSSYRAGMPGVTDIAAGSNLVVEPPRLLVQSFTALWSDDVKAVGETRVTWEITEYPNGQTKLTLTHDVSAAPDLFDEVNGGGDPEGGGGGWPWSLSGIKTLLETGQPMDA